MMLLPLVLLLAPVQDAPVHWNAALILDEDGTELPFGLELARDADGWSAALVNDPERIPVPEVSWDGTALTLGMPHYRSEIRASLEDGALTGEWTKVRGRGKLARVPFVARPGERARSVPAKDAAPEVGGRWAVDFADDDLGAVGIFEQVTGTTEVKGTFLTATGDYRFLDGTFADGALRLSCFDGAHAFLFEARLREDGSLAGTFRSGNWYSDSWTAVRDDDARVVDAFEQTSWDERVSLGDLAFPDTTGTLVSLADPSVAGRATLLVLFGSWCPNCHDEAPYLVELCERYRARGLSIVGLAFELTGSFEEDAAQVERFREKYGIPYTLLVAGTADKADATQAFGALDFLRSYPTTVFLSADGSVRAVHSGYAGPATGEAHAELRREFEGTIEALLAEEPVRPERTWSALTAQPWVAPALPDADDGTTLRFHGSLERPAVTWSTRTTPGRELAVELVGDAVWIRDASWMLRFDARAGVLRDPRSFGQRLTPPGDATPLLTRRGIHGEGALRAALTGDDPLVRREAVVAWTLAPPTDDPAALLALLALDEIEALRAAAWSLGLRRVRAAKEPLTKLLAKRHPHAGVRREVARALARLAEDDPSILLLFPPLEDDPHPRVRAIAARALGTQAVEDRDRAAGRGR